jgi:type IV pilus assembly protein PilC
MYSWKGIKGSEPVNGIQEAQSRQEAIDILVQQGIIITEISPEKKINSDANSGSDKTKPIKKSKKVKVQEADILLFTRKFSTMIEAGMAIVPALKMLQIQSENQGMKNILGEIVENVNSGVPLSKTLNKYPDLFDVVYLSLIEAGEASGTLDTFLKKISLGLEKKIKIIRQMKGALMYPIILLTVAIVVIAVMMIYVVPVFVEIFASGGVALPVPTEIVMTISDFFRSIWALITVGIFFAIFKAIQKTYRTNTDFRRTFDQKKLKMPLFGLLFQNMIMSRFASVLSNLVAGGVGLVDALEIAKNAVANQFMQDKLDVVKNDIYSGKPFGKSLRASKAFPETLCGFVEVGEETGKLNDMLETIAIFYEDEFDAAVEGFSQMLEPIMIVFLGVVIGFILVAMYMPIFQMGTAV